MATPLAAKTNDTTIAPISQDVAEAAPLVSPAPPLVTDPPRLVIVTLDGVRWQDVFAGTPHAADTPKRSVASRATDTAPFKNLQRIVAERGAAFGGHGCPHDVRVAGPSNISLPGYMEIFSGKASNSCMSNECPRTGSTTLLDDAAKATRGRDVAVFSSWSPYGRAATKDPNAMAMSVGGERGSVPKHVDDAKLIGLLDEGAKAPPFPGVADYRPDAFTAKAALRYLEVAEPRVLVVGLGDADEQAHRANYDGYYRALADADGFLGELDRTLERMGPKGRGTTVIVTTDHGRSQAMRDHGPFYRESARVWVAAWNGSVIHRGVTCAAQPLRLGHIAPAAKAVLGLGGDGGPLAVELLGGS